MTSLKKKKDPYIFNSGFWCMRCDEVFFDKQQKRIIPRICEKCGGEVRRMCKEGFYLMEKKK